MWINSMQELNYWSEDSSWDPSVVRYYSLFFHVYVLITEKRDIVLHVDPDKQMFALAMQIDAVAKSM